MKFDGSQHLKACGVDCTTPYMPRTNGHNIDGHKQDVRTHTQGIGGRIIVVGRFSCNFFLSPKIFIFTVDRDAITRSCSILSYPFYEDRVVENNCHEGMGTVTRLRLTPGQPSPNEHYRGYSIILHYDMSS